MPLRVRLTGAVLALVTGALVTTSVINVASLQDYMIGQVDANLESRFEDPDLGSLQSGGKVSSQYVYVILTEAGNAFRGSSNPHYNDDQLPVIHPDQIVNHVGQHFTVVSGDGSLRWRVLTYQVKTLNGSAFNTGEEAHLAIAAPLDTVDGSVATLVWIELLVGAGVLAGLAGIGVAVVRASLYPLKEMEYTASSIAAGDLSQRVVERDPHTEVGRLGRSFNLMLGHIESALDAREKSERRARESEERMRRFVADASHELRTPLTTVRGFAELYRQGGPGSSEHQADIMHRIELEATRMGMLVEDLLLLARLDQERPIELRQVDLLGVAVDTITAAEVAAGDRRIELHTRGGPFVVRGDEMRLRQVLSNLVSNAIRYTPDGSNITVSLSIVDEKAQLQVADDGPGMTEDQVDRVFERFYRADKARSRTEGSTGLGLAIVAALVAAHDGEVSLWSRPGEGAVFTVELRLDPDACDAQENAGTDSHDEANVESS